MARATRCLEDPDSDVLDGELARFQDQDTGQITLLQRRKPALDLRRRVHPGVNGSDANSAAVALVVRAAVLSVANNSIALTGRRGSHTRTAKGAVLDDPAYSWVRDADPECATTLELVGLPRQISPSLIAANHVSWRRVSSLSSRVCSPGTSGESGCAWAGLKPVTGEPHWPYGGMGVLASSRELLCFMCVVPGLARTTILLEVIRTDYE
jgi:hypothetical protein